MTADKFFDKYGGYFRDEMLQRAKEFAQYHVLLALEAAAEQAKIKKKRLLVDDLKEGENAYMDIDVIDRESILKSYSLDKIKVYEV